MRGLGATWAFLMVVGAACATAPPRTPRRPPGWEVGARRPIPGRATGGIAGRIVDVATGAPMMLVTVVATSPALQGPVSEFTDEAGQFHMTGLPSGSYDLLAIYGDVELRMTAVPVDTGADRLVTARLDVTTAEVFILGPCRPPVIEPGTGHRRRVSCAHAWAALHSLPPTPSSIHSPPVCS
jgi:hypothetical protein